MYTEVNNGKVSSLIPSTIYSKTVMKSVTLIITKLLWKQYIQLFLLQNCYGNTYYIFLLQNCYGNTSTKYFFFTKLLWKK